MAQRAELADAPRKSYNAPCVIAQTLDILGDRWTLLILRDLMSGLHRYNDIIENCSGMSPNVLSDRLKRLEADGLVLRDYYKELPPRVEYTLTEKGWSVRPILLALLDWGRTHVGPADLEHLDEEKQMTTDFAVRVLPAFSLHPERANGLAASMTVEISDCDDCNTWTFDIHDGHIHPRRKAAENFDLYLKTTTEGFFRFIRGESPPDACGELHGPVEMALTIQACFLAD
jgi:DNA-binding HxlR family transcriptional regulator